MFHKVFNFYVTFHSKKVIMWKKYYLITTSLSNPTC